MKRRVVSLALSLVFTAQLASSAEATIINLNDFFRDPPGAIAVAADGASAMLVEDANQFFVALANDPGLGDPNVIVPGAGGVLQFDYVFTEPQPGNDDEFGVFLVDVTTHGSVGAAFEFFLQGNGSGTVSFDLSSLAGMTIGLQFSMTSFPNDQELTSTLQISNVRIEQANVSEPGVLALLILAVIPLAGRRVFEAKRVV